VPEISGFFGIVIRMYMEAGVGHHTPHFHAYYQEHVGVFSIDPVDLIAGDLPLSSADWSKRGPNCIERSCRRTGTGFKRVVPRLPIAPLQ
jgi:hypothetical protein